VTDSVLVGELSAASPLTVMHEQLNANNDLSEQQISERATLEGSQ